MAYPCLGPSARLPMTRSPGSVHFGSSATLGTSSPLHVPLVRRTIYLAGPEVTPGRLPVPRPAVQWGPGVSASARALLATIGISAPPPPVGAAFSDGSSLPLW